MKRGLLLLLVFTIAIGSVYAAVPVIDSLAVNTTFGFGTTAENLTISAQYSDGDNDTVTGIPSWYKSGAPYEVLNLPFPGGSTSSTTLDYSDYNHSITMFSPEYSAGAGPYGRGAYTFNGSTSLAVADDPVLRLANGEDMTISLWVNTTGSADIQGLVAKRIHTPGIGEYYIYISTSNTVVGRVEDNDGDSATVVSNVTLQNNTWYHVTYVVEGQDSSYLYVNGNLTAENSNLADVDDIETIRLVEIASGNRYLTGSIIRKLYGQMAEVYMFKRALDPEQIQLLYQDGLSSIASAETAAAQNWQVCVTPNDGGQDGTEVCDNLVTQNVNQLLGTEGSVNTTGISSLNITLDNQENLTVTDFENHILTFYDGLELVINMTHDFSQSKINLSEATIYRDSNSLVVDFGGVSGSNKTLYLNDSTSQVFCVKNAPITSVSQISNTCQSSGEIRFTIAECSSNTTKSGVTCSQTGNVYAFSGLEYSGVLGAQSFAVPEFHEWALMILLTVALAGVVVLRRQ